MGWRNTIPLLEDSVGEFGYGVDLEKIDGVSK